MKTIIRCFVAAAAIATIAGCGPLAGMLTNPPVPLPGTSAAPGTAASMAPTTGASTTPTTPAASTPATTASTAPSGDGGEITDTSADCKLSSPAAPPEKGTAELGEFANQNLPNGWNKAYSTAAQIYEAIGKLDIDNWACFQKFYPGAAGLYKKKMGL